MTEALADTIKRPTDLVVRFGGEEFAITLGGTDLEGAATIAEEAFANIKALQVPHPSSKTSAVITISAGVATTLGRMEITEVDLINVADRALYGRKKTAEIR